MLGPEYVSLELDGTHDRLAPMEALRRLRKTLAGKVQATLRAEDQGRLCEWRSWLEEAWTSDQRAVYRWLKDEYYAPLVTFLSGPDGTATANLAETDGLLQDAWRPRNRKYATDAEPDPAAFLRRYGHHVRQVPMIDSRLDGPRLRKGLSRMKPSALGLDKWSMADLHSLPDRLLDPLVDVLREVEPRATQPSSPRRAPPGPLNTRPLTVLSMVYRPWAGVRLADAIAWQGSWAQPVGLASA